MARAEDGYDGSTSGETEAADPQEASAATEPEPEQPSETPVLLSSIGVLEPLEMGPNPVEDPEPRERLPNSAEDPNVPAPAEDPESREMVPTPAEDPESREVVPNPVEDPAPGVNLEGLRDLLKLAQLKLEAKMMFLVCSCRL